MAGLTSQQKHRLLKLMKSGFEDYATVYGNRRHVGALTDSPEQNGALIRSYGEEFGRILDGQTGFDDLPDLQEDLFSLFERGCPLLDIIDLMFACTSGRTRAVSDTLASVGLNDPALYALRLACYWVAEKISALNTAPLPGPLALLSDTFPELSIEDQAEFTHAIQQLPGYLQVFGDVLRFYPPDKIRSAGVEALLRDCDVHFFYLLLSHFNFGCPTLSRLLTAMRHVRYTVSPKAQYLRPIGPARSTRNKRSESYVPHGRDPLSELALQRRLHRFSKKAGNWQFFIHVLLLQYLSDEFADQRAHGATFFSLWRQLQHTLNMRFPFHT